MGKINEIKRQIKDECEKNVVLRKLNFYNIHLLAVEKNAKFLLSKLPKADKESLMLGVWLHDLQRIRNLAGDHEKVGASEAEKVMKDYDFEKNKIKKVKDIILSHSCQKIPPTSLEGEILSSADAMSHYENDFYLSIAVTGERNLKEYKNWLIEKLNRNLNKKIFFKFAKNKIIKKHNAFMTILK